MNQSKKQQTRRSSKKFVRKNNRDSSGDSSRLRIPDKSLLLWGKHAVTAALENPDRRIYELFFSESSQTKIQKLIRSRLSISEASKIKLNALSSKDITALLPDHSVHQGFAAIVGELDYGDLDFLINKTRSSKYSFVGARSGYRPSQPRRSDSICCRIFCRCHNSTRQINPPIRWRSWQSRFGRLRTHTDNKNKKYC